MHVLLAAAIALQFATVIDVQANHRATLALRAYVTFAPVFL
jgi:hypothetical protein